MRRNPRLFRLTASVALLALLCNAARPPHAVAQPAPPPLPQPYQSRPSQPEVDPPTRVGRVARLSGTVSFRNAGDTQWSPASVNFPVSAGNAFWTEPSASAELDISDSRIVLAGTTEFDTATFDGSGLQAVAAQGEAYLHLRNLDPAEAWSVQTPRGLVRLGGAGQYDIVVGTTEAPTLITVIDGAAEIEGPGVALHVGSGQTATISGSDSFQGSVGPARNDPFLTANLSAERPRPAAAMPPQVTAMPGGSDLAGYGSWAPAAEYGQVWYPPVASGWVPYRQGHWAFVAPWGWTWIDDAPWGFAPFHYGRWVEIDGRWAWTPGRYAVAQPPAYAPALVAFIGVGAGVALGAAIAARSICWVPLGPREPYRPWYHASDGYVRQFNGDRTTTINNNSFSINNYVNRRAATLVPDAAMAASRPVQSAAQPITPAQLASARPIIGQQPVVPTAATSGVTPAVARQFNLGPASGLRAAPGPAVAPRAPGPTLLPQGGGVGFARPAGGPPGRPEPAASVGARPGVVPVSPAAQVPAPALHPAGVLPPAIAPSGGTSPVAHSGPEQAAVRPGAGVAGIAAAAVRPGAGVGSGVLPPAIAPSGGISPVAHGVAEQAPVRPGAGAAGIAPAAVRPGAGVGSGVLPPAPAMIRPGAGVASAVPPVSAGQVPRVEPRPLPQVIAPSRPAGLPPSAPTTALREEPQHFAPPHAVPRMEAPHQMPPAAVARMEAPHPMPPAAVTRMEAPHPMPPAAVTRVEAPHPMPPPAAPVRVAEPHFAPPGPAPQHIAPQAEPRAAPQPAAARPKRPGEP